MHMTYFLNVFDSYVHQAQYFCESILHYHFISKIYFILLSRVSQAFFVED